MRRGMQTALVVACGAVALAEPAGSARVKSEGQAGISVEWGDGLRTNSHPTYQTSINPLYRIDGREGSSNISKVVFDNMKRLRADYMRHVPWFPYPRLAIAALQPPQTLADGSCTTSWDFTYIDPITNALFEALDGHPVVMNFATTPEWLWMGGENVSYPEPNIRNTKYNKHTELRDPSYAEIIGYWTRLAEYYTRGGMTDECGVFHKGYNYTFEWWEVTNEPESEHALTPEKYNELYDAVVPALQKVLPDTKFLGLALGGHNEWGYYETFLNRTKHTRPDTPINGISFHTYVSTDHTDAAGMSSDLFPALDTFLLEVANITTIRNKFATTTPVEVFINEIGCAAPKTYSAPGYYNACAAAYAYLFVKASLYRIDHVGMSQVIGFEGRTVCDGCGDEWPSTSMVNWMTGAGNARYHTLAMLIDAFPVGGKTAHPTTATLESLAAQAFTLADGTRRLVVVNTGATPATIAVPAAYTVAWVDGFTGDAFGCTGSCVGRKEVPSTDAFTLGAFGVAVFTL